MFHTQIPKKKTKNILIVGMIIIAISIFLLTSYFLNKDKKISYQAILENQEKDIVYNLENSKVKENDKVPRINLNTEQITKVNEEIEQSYEDYLTKFTEEYTYQYNISNNILSLLITSKQRYHDSNHYDITYKSYNIDLENLKILTDDELFERFNIKKEQLRYFITYKFVNYYNDLLKQEYFTEEECDYSCFIENREFTDYLEENQYYVNNNQLEVYKYFNIFTDYNEEEYFTEDSFHFIIK